MMPVLHQPVYLAHPVAWEEPENEKQSDHLSTHLPASSFNGNLPIDEMELNFAESANNAGVDLQKVRREGYEAGYRDGFLAGQKEGYRQGFAAAEQAFKEQQWQQHQYVQQLISNMAEVIRNELANFFSRAEEAVTEFALEIARKIIEVEAKTNPEVVRKAVSQALQELKSGTVTLRIHPEDFSLLGNDLSWLNLEDGVSVKVVPDETVERGGVIAESEQGLVDLQPHTKLALLQSEVF